MIITRYLTREVLNALLLVTIVLMLIFFCQQVLRYLNYAAIGKIPASILFELVGLEAPFLLSLLLPLGLYLGIMIAYGRLYADNEMAILQMCGYGRLRIMKLSAWLAFAVAAVILCLMLWVNPWVSAKQRQVLASDEATLQLVQTMIPGRFQVSPNGTHVMYVEKLSRDRQRAETVFLAQEKVSRDESTDQHSWMLVLANEGYQIKDKETQEDFFVTTDGYRYEGTPGQNDYKVIQFRKYAVRVPPTNVHISHIADETLSTSQLWQDYSNPKRAAELQWRFSIALSAILLAFLAVSFSVLKPRQGRYGMLFPAIVTYIIYVNLLFIARHWVEQGKVPIWLGMWWVHGLLILFIALVAFLKARKST